MISLYGKEKTDKPRDPLFQFILRRKKEAVFVGCGIILGVFLGWNVIEVAIFSVFIWSILGPISSRYLAWPALFFLLFTSVLMALGRREQAEEFAIYAYYFMVMVVIRGIIEIRAERSEESFDNS